MNIFIVICLLSILIETSFLSVHTFRKQSFRQGQRRKVYIDTSALIDGRILPVAQTGFMGDDLIIPRSVIRELQLLADGKDSDKRLKARAGLDLVNELERVVFCNVEILQDELDKTPVDERLIELAKKNKGLILTCDFNLEKVATTEKIDVLNINQLALSLQNDFLPGDKMKVKISSKGQNPRQGVGYLLDGIMVVVDNAAKYIGKEIEVEFIRFLQTQAGRMMFARIVSRKKK